MKIIKSTEYKTKEADIIELYQNLNEQLNNEVCEIKIDIENLKTKKIECIEKKINNLYDSDTEIRLNHSKLYSNQSFLKSDFLILEKKTKKCFLILFLTMALIMSGIITILIKGA